MKYVSNITEVPFQNSDSVSVFAVATCTVVPKMGVLGGQLRVSDVQKDG